MTAFLAPWFLILCGYIGHSGYSYVQIPQSSEAICRRNGNALTGAETPHDIRFYSYTCVQTGFAP